MSEHPRNPIPTVDVILELSGRGIVLIWRKNEPVGWALPGGYVDYGESLEQAAVREAEEEIGLRVEIVRQFHTYSDPRRDPRQHTMSTVFIVRSDGEPQSGDDAARVEVFPRDSLPERLCFDHGQILSDFLEGRY